MNYGLILLIIALVAATIPFFYQAHLSNKLEKWKKNNKKSNKESNPQDLVTHYQ